MFRAYRCVRRRRTPTREREPFVNVSQYLEIRRCYNRMRRETPSSSRITFDEFAILCILHQRKGLSSTQLAAEQGVSCPTMTHRGNHLAQLGYMTRSSSDSDRRRLRCALTRKGTSYVNRTVQRIAQAADPASGLAELEPSEVVSLVTKMGSRPMSADELTLLCFAHADTRSMPIVRIVEATSMLQPTVSMAVLRLEGSGCIEHAEGRSATGRRPMRRSSGCVLTDAGAEAAARVARQVEEL